MKSFLKGVTQTFKTIGFWLNLNKHVCIEGNVKSVVISAMPTISVLYLIIDFFFLVDFFSSLDLSTAHISWFLSRWLLLINE